MTLKIAFSQHDRANKFQYIFDTKQTNVPNQQLQDRNQFS